MGSGIDPKVDYAFKRVFGSEDSRAVLRHLLNAVLKDWLPRPMREVWIMNPFSHKDAIDDRLAILDIKACDEEGREYLVEMQLYSHAAFPERLLFYGARHYSQQLSEGQDYTQLRPIIVVCFANEVLFPDAPGYHGRYELVDLRQGVRFSDHLTLHVIELPKFVRKLDELHEDIERWTYFLQHGDELDAARLPAALAIPEIRQATGILTMLSQNDHERELYEARLKQSRDESSRLHYAITKGRMEGQIEGRTEATRAMLLRIGARRLGSPPPGLLAAIDAITDIERLENLADRVVEISSWDELLPSS